jgi:restriction system protein
MLGAKSIHADECFKGNFIGADFDINFDLTNNLPDNWRDFNQKYIPEWLTNILVKVKWQQAFLAELYGQ